MKSMQSDTAERQESRPGLRQKLSGLLHFYRDGFRSMRTGKTLWRIILLKIAVFLLILKLFFPNFLQTHFRTDQQRADHVLNNLTNAGTIPQPNSGILTRK